MNADYLPIEIPAKIRQASGGALVCWQVVVVRRRAGYLQIPSRDRLP